MLMGWTSGEAEYATTDSTGAFAFHHLSRRGMPVVLEWNPAQDVSIRRHFDEPPSEADRVDLGTVRFSPNYVQQIRVVDRQDRALPGVLVRDLDAKEADNGEVSTTSKEGHASFWLQEGTHRFVVDGLRSHAPLAVTVGSLLTPKIATLVVDDPAWISGEVTYDGGGLPNYGDLVMLITGPEVLRHRDRETVSVETIRDSFSVYAGLSTEGTFRFPVPKEWSEVEVAVGTESGPMMQGDFDHELARVRVPVSVHAVVVRVSHLDGMGFRVQVLDKSGVAVEGASIRMVHKQGWFEVLPKSDVHGRATLFPIRPGTWGVRAIAPDGRVGETRNVKIEGPTWPDVTVRLDR
jgi:hypothetical protein